MGTYLDSIVERSEPELIALFELRPDLANPSPGNLNSLAARASNTASVLRVLASFNARTLQVLEAMVVLDSLNHPLNLASVALAITARSVPSSDAGQGTVTAEHTAIEQELDLLRTAALVWQDGDHLKLAPGVENTADRFPAGFGPLSANTPSLEPLPQQAPPHAQGVLDTLLWGPPVALVARNLLSINPSANEPETNESLRWLLRNGYLELLDETHVYLPRQTAFALRGNRTHKSLTAPPLTDAQPSVDAASVQAQAATAASEIVRLVAELISVWGVQPAPSLRNGGLPVREAKRLAMELDVSTEIALLVAEIAYAARLVRPDDSAARDFVPTTAADAWLELDLPHRWSHLVQGWLASQRQPWRIGAPDEKGNAMNALHPENHAQWVPRLRANVLGVLKEHALIPVTASALVDQLAWYAPRGNRRADAIEGLLTESDLLGLTSLGVLLPGVDSEGFAAAMSSALPAPVSEIFIQADLTGMVPGRPAPALQSLLEACSVVESRGGALTVRFTTESITRAFDSGMGAAELVEDLTVFSVTPLPQPLTYLIADVARRHGQVRVGAISSYIKLADEPTAAAVLALPTSGSVGLFEIAPGVLGASAPIHQVLTVLREGGFAPAIEGPDGQIVAMDRSADAARAQSRQGRSVYESPTGVSTTFGGDSALRDIRFVAPSVTRSTKPPARLVQLVKQVIAGTDGSGNTSSSRAVEDRASDPQSSKTASKPKPVPAQPQPDNETSLIVVNLRQAMSAGGLVSIALADGAGRLSHRVVKPLTLESGRLRALDPERESELTIAIHRIASVTLLEQN